MNTNTLAHYENNGIELLVDTQTGESFASISGYARLAGKDKSTISRRLQTVAQTSVKQAEIPTKTGLKTVALIPEDLIVEWLPKDNPSMATQLMKIGVRAFLHQLAGYSVTSTAIAPETKKGIYDKLSKNGIVIYVGEGQTATTVRGLAMLAGCHQESIRILVDRLDLLSEIQTKAGRSIKVITEGDIEIALEAIITGHQSDRNKEKAQDLYEKLHKVNWKLTAFLGLNPIETQLRVDLGDNPFGLPCNFKEAVELLCVKAQEIETLEEQVEELETQIEEALPKVEFADAVAESSDCVTLLVYAKLINTGRGRLFTLLRQMEILMKDSTLPYQEYIDRGYFSITQKKIPNGELVQSALVTGKGQVWLKGRIDKFFDSQPQWLKSKFFPLEEEPQPPTGKVICQWIYQGQTTSAVADFGGVSC